MSKEIAEILWDNVPENLKPNELLKGYIDTISETFEEINQQIKTFDDTNDYLKTDPNNLVSLGVEKGYRFPRNISDDIKRRTIRDFNKISSRLGTRASLLWALKTLGLTNLRVDELWIPNPEVLRVGYFRGIRSSPGDETRYQVRENSYIDWVVGEAVPKDNGTFFEGWEYTDVQQKEEDKITDIPIYGEVYKDVNLLDLNNTVQKSPYVVVRIFEEDYEAITDDYTDPNTGEQYQYTDRERREIVQQMVHYFIYILQRSANTRIIFVTDTEVFEESIPRIGDNLETSTSIVPLVYDFEDSLSGLGDDFIKSLTYESNTLPENFPIGESYVPYFGVGMYIKIPTLGNWPSGSPYVFEIEPNQRQLDSLNNSIKNHDRIKKEPIFLDSGAFINMTLNGFNSNVSLFGRVNYQESDPSDDVFLGQLSDNGQTLSLNNITRYHVVIVEINTIGLPDGEYDTINYEVIY